MTRGRKPGSGASAERILAALKALGTETDGRPKSIRAAQLSDRAKIPHHSLAKAVEPLLTLGHITRCLVTGARGQQTYEYRLGCGAPPPSFKPLNLHKAGGAIGKPGKPLPVTTPAPKVSTPKPPATEIEVPQLKRAKATTAAPPDSDVELLERLQQMDEPQFTDYLRHLARVWSWGRTRRLVDAALAHP